jgi:hypothetical protein
MEALIQILRERNERVPRPLPRVTPDDIARAEVTFGRKLPPDYVQLQLGAGDVTFGPIEPATLQPESGHTHIGSVIEGARAVGLPASLLPICEDNGAYYCLAPDGKVQYWLPTGPTNEEWASLAEWVREVWLASGSG